MLDKKSYAVLKILSKLTEGSAYKVVTADEIISNLAQKSQYDADSIKQIIDFLEKQEYIIIKFFEENTYCYSLSPKGRICLEQEGNKQKIKKSTKPFLTYLYTAIASFVGCLIALFVFFYLIF